MSDVTDLFPGFQSHWIDTEAGRIFARSGGSGPPLVLLHGFPQTHVMWHRIAPSLAGKFTIVAMDLRGYGWSSVPSSEGGVAYTKREMGKDVVAVMQALGHVRFRICGHDRGARVGYRLALDHPGRVEALALLDILPFTVVWENIRAGQIPAAHWAFLSQPAPGPESAIQRAPDTFLEGLMAGPGRATSRSAPSMPVRSRNIGLPGAIHPGFTRCARTTAPARTVVRTCRPTSRIWLPDARSPARCSFWSAIFISWAI